jgi:catechol 2,3-dioxygenase-like lactoylglutathione lyase family enzyme
MKTLSTTPVIHVTDLQNAVSYYTTILGLKFDFKFGDYAGLTYGDLGIHLSGPASPGIKKLPGNAHFCIDCDEVDAYYHEISKKGALINVSIDDRHYGVRDFAVNDHDGNTLVFGAAIN